MSCNGSNRREKHVINNGNVTTNKERRNRVKKNSHLNVGRKVGKEKLKIKCSSRIINGGGKEN